ncbi:hypothetical protein FA10DRAFT_268224 [Acaromyces ingoldii]|uniref:Uncharacterized protein n=1 Tax=Acaromyces ingoldii TaxID=215250 RepID=A0A316YPN4_9BASI|nr:hypothetical protein FA10DRAFT_268224 [Acaromyces ingoldii]PWN89705.1 hypothetical protein FA10DRAFT_268224 [Acaromyces ingoldii]
MPPLKALGSYLRRNDSPSGTVTPPVIDGLRRPHRPLSATDTDAGHDGESRGRRAEQHDEQESTHEEQQEEAWELVEVARGLANYNSIESERIKGIKSSQIAATLGYADSDYIVDQLALHAFPSEPMR